MYRPGQAGNSDVPTYWQPPLLSATLQKMAELLQRSRNGTTYEQEAVGV